MSTQTYSEDLRVRVIKGIKEGSTFRDVGKRFGIGHATAHRWWTRYKKEQTIKARKRGGSKGKIDPEALVTYVKAHPDQTLAQTGAYFGVRAGSIHKRLKAMGFSYKKNVFVQRSRPPKAS